MPPPLNEPDHQPEHHPQGEPVEEDAENVEWRGNHGEERQGRLGQDDQGDDLRRRRCGGIAAITRIPSHFDAVYPST